MEKTIELEKKIVAYTLRRNNRSRAVRLSVAAGGVMIVTAPPTLRQNVIEHCILRKSEWVLDTIRYFSTFPRPRKAAKTPPRGKRHFAEHRDAARTLVQGRLGHFNQFYKFAWTRISIRNQKSRWGSCSRNGNLHFNYKIALLTPSLADYIIVHELCHLGAFNHSRAFWDLVAQTLPDHRMLRKELRKTPLT